MSHSSFKITEPDAEESLTLVIAPDGTITPSRDIVKNILKSRSKLDINVMVMKKVEAEEVNVTVDNLMYINTDDMEDPAEMSEVARNLHNLRMDHDYTPLMSPNYNLSNMDIVDELAQTLSMLEDGSYAPQEKESLTKITKIVKGKKQTVIVTNKQKQKMLSAGLLKEQPLKSKSEIEDEELQMETSTASEDDDKSGKRTSPRRSSTSKQIKGKSKSEEISPAKQESEKKVLPKKDKRPSKPPDDFALFSAPDLIRRVDAEKSPPKAARISSERSKSTSETGSKRTSTDANKSSPEKRRHSVEPTKNDNICSSGEKTKELLEEEEENSRVRIEEGQVSVQDFSETMSNSNESIDDDQLEPLPSAEDIRAMIHSESTKTFTMGTVLPDTTATTTTINEAEAASAGVVAPVAAEVDQSGSNLNIDPAGLELDPSILDNINTDLSEDLLFQVAQSLAENTELQNAFEKSLNDGNLTIDAPSIDQAVVVNESQAKLVESKQFTADTAAGNVSSSESKCQNAATAERINPENSAGSSSGSTQVVRPDGRVVIIPPIERPTTRSRNRAKDPEKEAQPPKPASRPIGDDHVSGEELDSSGEEEEESDDDPNKLWCICNQPHNNRFMICCDTCEEWYHGKCVNVTKAMGQIMEQEGKEWICVYCKDANLQRPKAALRRMRKASRNSSDSASSKSKSSTGNKARPETAKASSGPGCVVCGKPCRNSSIYCSDPCILKHAQGVEKVVVYDRKTGRLLSGNNAPSAANLDKWLAENPSFEALKANSKFVTKIQKNPNLVQSKLKLVKNPTSPGVSLAVQKKGVNVGILSHAPKTPPSKQPLVLNSIFKPKGSANEISGLKVISKQIALKQMDNKAKIKIMTTSPSSKPQATSTVVKQKIIIPKQSTIKKETLPMPQKTPKARQAEISKQPKQENLRETVRKTFFEQLSTRIKQVDDVKLSDDELREVSNEIESQLYKCFADTGQKYRNKYRSLIFNIKDPKNETLWRRICEKAISPYQLVRLSPDDLASQELALWREREAKHQLDMIKKSELDLLNCSRQFVFKTHKGETVYEDDRAKDQVTDVISSVTRDTQLGESEEAEAKETSKSSAKHSRRDRERSRERSKSSREKDRRRDSKDRKRRSRSRDRRSSRHSDRKRSRSRDKHKSSSSHKSSRHKKEDKTINTDKLDKKSKEILEQLVDKHIVPPLEDRAWKQDEPAPAAESQPAQPTESDSDHEPSSTVSIPTPPRVADSTESKKEPEQKQSPKSVEKPAESSATSSAEKPQESFWKGTLNMVDVAQISISAQEVSGDCSGLRVELPKSLDIVGRIAPDTVWEYIGKMRSSNSKSISVIKLTPSSSEEKTAYSALYSYLSSRQRLGVVKVGNKRVKDFYILPLASHTPIPEVLLPINGPGFGSSRPSLMIGIIVRDNRKRTHESASGHYVSKKIRVEVANSHKASNTPPPVRSYTPPPARDSRIKLPVPNLELPEDEDMDEPYSPADSDPDTVTEPLSSRLNTSDITNLLTGSVKASSFLESGFASQTFEPFSGKFDGIPGLDVVAPAMPSSSLEIQKKMAELDQEIAAQKAEIDKVSQDLVSKSDLVGPSLANIALPSNLQQILESIKSIGTKSDSTDSQGENSNSLPGSNDLTIPLLLPKVSNRSASPPIAIGVAEPTIPLNLPGLPKLSKPKSTESTGSVLSSLSEEDLIKKAAEMLGETEPAPKAKTPPPPPITLMPKPSK